MEEGQKKEKRTNDDIQNSTQKIKVKQHELHQKLSTEFAIKGYYGSSLSYKATPTKATVLSRTDFICAEIVDYYYTVSIKIGHPLIWPIFHRKWVFL